jgi:hypothetical protein
MTKSDRNVLAVLAVSVGIAWLASLRPGNAFGWPALTSGRLPDKEGGKAPKRPRSSSSTTGPAGGSGAGGKGPPKKPDGIMIEVSNPKVISVEEWQKRHAAAARARAQKP